MNTLFNFIFDPPVVYTSFGDYQNSQWVIQFLTRKIYLISFNIGITIHEDVNFNSIKKNYWIRVANKEKVNSVTCGLDRVHDLTLHYSFLEDFPFELVKHSAKFYSVKHLNRVHFLLNYLDYLDLKWCVRVKLVNADGTMSAPEIKTFHYTFTDAIKQICFYKSRDLQ